MCGRGRFARPAPSCWVLALGGLIACGAPPSTTPRAPAVLRVPLPRDIRTLDPTRGDEITTFNVIRQLYEGLVDYDPASLAVVPRLARSWSVSPDGLVWRFALRQSVRFVDDPCFPSGAGREVTAADVKYSMERCLGLFRGGGSRVELPAIVGLARFLSGSADEVAGISTPSPQEVGIRLMRPDPVLLHFLVRPCCDVVPREAVELYGEDLGLRAVGTGPFRVVSWQPLAGLLLVRNLRYGREDERGAALPYLDALRFVPAAHESQGRLYAQGQIDVAMSYVRAVAAAEPPGAAAQRTAPPPGEQQFFVPRLNTIYIRFDYRSAHPAVRDRRLREALAAAAPRPAGTMNRAAHGLFPPELPGFDPALLGQRTDPERAASLLREAGHPRGSGLPILRLAWREWDAGVGRAVAQAFRVMGLEVELREYSDREYEAAIERGESDLFRAGWMADFPDPQNFLGLFYSGARENVGRYADPEFDALFERLRVEPDAELRTPLARRLERLLLADAAAIFLHHEQESQFVSARIENWQDNGTNPLNVIFFERLRLRTAGEVAGR